VFCSNHVSIEQQSFSRLGFLQVCLAFENDIPLTPRLPDVRRQQK
jgi:hypothetical protein